MTGVMAWTVARLTGAPMPPLAAVPGRVFACRDEPITAEDLEHARLAEMQEVVDRQTRELADALAASRRGVTDAAVRAAWAGW